jgi:hypothetical protein
VTGASAPCTATVTSTTWSSGTCSPVGLPVCSFAAAKS